MTSLIFGSIYLGHKGIVNHRREKRRQKNYERWEGLRDEYDEQKKIQRESRSLDLQRTGDGQFGYGPDPSQEDRPILTLRDQQEANDARTSWRPQESWEPPRRASIEVTSSGLREVRRHKTGSTWDEDLPEPLPVHRRNWDEYNSNLGRQNSLASRDRSKVNTPSGLRTESTSSSSIEMHPTDATATTATTKATMSSPRSVSLPPDLTRQKSVEVLENTVPGGRMAELIEMGNSANSKSTSQPPAGMVEWWNRA